MGRGEHYELQHSFALLPSIWGGEGEATMGKISQFSGRCHTEISFMVGDLPFRAVMVKERKGSHHGQDSAPRTEEVVIRLWMGEAGVVVQSLQQGQQQPAFSCSGEGISDAEVVQFGLIWMRETRCAVEEAANGGKSTEVTNQEEVPAPVSLDQFFQSIFTFLNGDM